MEISTLTFNREDGWSAPLPVGLDSARTAVFIFGAPSYINDSAPFDTLTAAFPQAMMIGCSTSGEIFNQQVQDETLVAAIVRFTHTTLHLITQPIKGAADSYECGLRAARRLARPDLQGILLFSDGIHVNGSELVRGLNQLLPAHVLISGGLAGDGDRFAHTWVIKDGRPAEKQIAALALYGDHIRIRHGSRGGWDIFGPERLITRSQNNILYELDGRPALQLYKNYLGELSEQLPASALRFPLAIRLPDAQEKQVVRTILSINEADQAMIFAGDMPQGVYAQLMKANHEQLIDGAAAAAEESQQMAQTVETDASFLSLAISCVGRRLVLGERTEEELEAVLEILPPITKQIGFYSYGEFSPSAKGNCDLHNQTMTLTIISEVS